MIRTTHEQGRNRRRYYGVEKLRRELDSGIRKFAAVLGIVNSVFMLLTAAMDRERIPDAMVLPVCSVLLIAALIFLRNAVLQYAAEMYGITQNKADKSKNCTEKDTEIPENRILSA